MTDWQAVWNRVKFYASKKILWIYSFIVFSVFAIAGGWGDHPVSTNLEVGFGFGILIALLAPFLLTLCDMAGDHTDEFGKKEKDDHKV